MAPPPDRSWESEEAWRVRAFRSKKAVPRPYKPSPNRILAPRPQPLLAAIAANEELRPINTRGEPLTPNPGRDTSSPSTPLLQFTPTTLPLTLKKEGARELGATETRNENSREKRLKISHGFYTETRRGAGPNGEEPSSGTPPTIGRDEFEDIPTPSSAYDALSGCSPSFDSGAIKEEVLSPQAKPISPPLSRTPTQSLESRTGDGNDSDSAALVSPNPHSFFGGGRSDPFNSYPIRSSPQMDFLIDCFWFHCGRSEASQPFAVFSSLLIPDRDLVYPKSLVGVKTPGSQLAVFPILFRLALTDPPLFNTLLFIGEFATHGRLTEDALQYQGCAIRTLNEKLRDHNKAIENASISTILLLSGFEYIKGNNRPAHEAHMKGLAHLLKLRTEMGTRFIESKDEREVMERGLFWIDLLGAVLLGSRRFLSLEAFTTMRLLGAKSRPTNPLPSGFARCIHLLNDDLIEILRDIVDFQEVIESRSKSNAILDRPKVFNDRKASIEFRLASLDLKGLAGGKSECCRLAAYLFSSAIFPPMFGPPPLAVVLSTQLATALAKTNLTLCWDADIKSLLWICFVGESHTDPQSHSSIFTNVLSTVLSRLGRTCGTWERTSRVLEDFLWSETVLGDPCRRVAERLNISP